jgi:hypothetical protein
MYRREDGAREHHGADQIGDIGGDELATAQRNHIVGRRSLIAKDEAIERKEDRCAEDHLSELDGVGPGRRYRRWRITDAAAHRGQFIDQDLQHP